VRCEPTARDVVADGAVTALASPKVSAATKWSRRHGIILVLDDEKSVRWQWALKTFYDGPPAAGNRRVSVAAWRVERRDDADRRCRDRSR